MRRLDDPAITKRAKALMKPARRRESLDSRLVRTGHALMDEFSIPYSVAVGYAYISRGTTNTAAGRKS